MIWVQHSDDDLAEGSDGWQYVPELQREESEPLVHKQYGDAFEATDLESELTERGVGRLIVTGAQTDACIRATLHGAFTRGYDTLLVADAHTTEDFSEVRAAAGGQGHRPHEHVLDVASGPGSHGGGRRGCRRRLRLVATRFGYGLHEQAARRHDMA